MAARGPLSIMTMNNSYAPLNLQIAGRCEGDRSNGANVPVSFLIKIKAARDTKSVESMRCLDLAFVPRIIFPISHLFDDFQ